MNGKDLVPRSLGGALNKAVGLLQGTYNRPWLLCAFIFHKKLSAVLKDVDKKADQALKAANVEAAEIDGLVDWVMEAVNELQKMRSGYLPLGTYHLMLSGRLDTVNSASKPDLLDLGLLGILPGSSTPRKFLHSLFTFFKDAGTQFQEEFVDSHNMQHPVKEDEEAEKAEKEKAEKEKQEKEKENKVLKEGKEKTKGKKVLKEGKGKPEPEKPLPPTYISSLQAVYTRVSLAKSAVKVRLGWTSASQQPPSTGECSPCYMQCPLRTVP